MLCAYKNVLLDNMVKKLPEDAHYVQIIVLLAQDLLIPNVYHVKLENSFIKTNVMLNALQDSMKMLLTDYVKYVMLHVSLVTDQLQTVAQNALVENS